MDEQIDSNSFLDYFGGRKFILAIIIVGAIVAIVFMKPAALTTETVVGLLGVLATFSGSNAFLTQLSSKTPTPINQAIQTPQTVSQPAPSTQPSQASQASRIDTLEARVNELEKNQAQLVGMIKESLKSLTK